MNLSRIRLRAYYLDRDETPIFQSVILAGVYDVRNIREYEEDRRTGMYIAEVSKPLSDYTSGYPYLLLVEAVV